MIEAALDDTMNQSPQAHVAAWRSAIRAHPGLAALRAFNARLASGEPLAPAAARAFIASLYVFNRSTPAGIAQLAGRWADALILAHPFDAHAIAASVLDSAVDEFGLAGTRPHVQLFRDFGAHWDLAPSAILDPAHAVPAARELGARVEAWYRTAPLTEALAIHFVSEETSAEEFAGWYPIFPDSEYTRVHALLEPGHSSDAGAALARHLAEQTDAGAHEAVVTGAIETYLALYRAMFEQIMASARMAEPGLRATC